MKRLTQLLDEADTLTRANILQYLKNEKPEIYQRVRKFILAFEDFETLAVACETSGDLAAAKRAAEAAWVAWAAAARADAAWVAWAATRAASAAAWGRDRGW